MPVLVTGIQCSASALRETVAVRQRSSHRADARWLDSCDEHRKEGDGSFCTCPKQRCLGSCSR
ncbi:hypothetical protein EQW76_10515 [Rhizobium sp. rho-13.1]|nr:hypothetical protein EQW76_10515 [Rhizobium sp. rho-13.1]TQY16272.1 hypothetical protein EQW74_10105 [Rhizobium sp. rho-1.1]